MEKLEKPKGSALEITLGLFVFNKIERRIIMYDLRKRQEMRNVEVKEVIELLQKLPENAKVLFNGDNYGYVHIEKDDSIISFDDSSLDDDYYYDGQLKD